MAENTLTEEQIKRMIKDLLTHTPVYYSQLVVLTNELAKFDSENVRFSVDALICPSSLSFWCSRVFIL